jgi:hypothetical protein
MIPTVFFWSLDRISRPREASAELQALAET